jgi:hypothetical protein
MMEKCRESSRNDSISTDSMFVKSNNGEDDLKDMCEDKIVEGLKYQGGNLDLILTAMGAMENFGQWP